mmetsp:Transcript_59181/g.128015  ORF Transcript_59181/g.128015 Transcript_59181/m.128015 type:complete len:211 (+) Transcript_59181:81-713(+)
MPVRPDGDKTGVRPYGPACCMLRAGKECWRQESTRKGSSCLASGSLSVVTPEKASLGVALNSSLDSLKSFSIWVGQTPELERRMRVRPVDTEPAAAGLPDSPRSRAAPTSGTPLDISPLSVVSCRLCLNFRGAARDAAISSVCALVLVSRISSQSTWYMRSFSSGQPTGRPVSIRAKVRKRACSSDSTSTRFRAVISRVRFLPVVSATCC